MRIFLYLLLLFFVKINFCNAQNPSLKAESDRIKVLFQKEPDKAFAQSNQLLEQALAKEDFETTLSVYSMHCWYLFKKSDHKALLQTANNLKITAKKYNSKRHEAIAHIYLSQTYTINEMFDRAIEEYEKAISILNSVDKSCTECVVTRRNAHIYVSNTYLKMQKPEMAVKKLLLAVDEYKNMAVDEDLSDYKFLDYSNLAAAYLQYDLDSAEYYVLKSINYKPEKGWEHNMFLNYSVLGDIHNRKGNYQEALFYYKQADNFEPEYTDLLNLEVLYKEILSVYRALDDESNVKTYDLKLKEVQLRIADAKYKSMLHMLMDKENSASDRSHLLFIVFIIIASIITALFLVRKFIKRKSSHSDANREDPIPDNIENIRILTDLAKSNDPSFMNTFLEVYPDFSKNLLHINPNLAQTEIEFCMYLKLNFSSKEIANFKFIQPRSVQNKKHRIRKRLHIEENIDIYHWFTFL